MECKTSTIKEFLSQPDLYFQIPVYQRNFCWDTDQCRVLFDDVYNAMENGLGHFLGTICYKYDDENNDIIIDGQQRITCLMLFFKALYDVSTDQSVRERIQRQYLLNPCDGDKFKLKLKPIQRDAGIYKRLLSQYHVDDGVFKEWEMATPLYRAFFNFKCWINELTEIPDFEHRLMATLESLTICEMKVTNENPQEIFESINATGVPLTNVDVLRNYLLMTLPYKDQVRLYNDYWMPIEESVTTERLEDFVCSYLVYKQRSACFVVNGKGWNVSAKTICMLFRHCYPSLNTVESVEAMFKDMLRAARAFAHCVYRASTKPETLGPIDSRLYELCYTLGADQCAAAIIYLFDSYDKHEFDEDTFCGMLNTMISLVFRLKVCRGARVSYRTAAGLISRLDRRTDNDDYVKVFNAAIAAGHGTYAFPSDFAFRQALTTSSLEGLKSSGQKYLLYSIEKHLNPTQPTQMSGGSIEHIMPQKLSDAWTKYIAFHGGNEKFHREYVNILGNLTLTDSNSSLSNKPFIDKRSMYEDSLYLITKDLASSTVWSKRQIDERSERLCDAALEIWPDVDHSHIVDLSRQYKLPCSIANLADQRPATFTFLGETLPCDSWTGIGVGVIDMLYQCDPESLEKLADSPSLPFPGLISYEYDPKRQSHLIASSKDLYLNQAKNPRQLLKQLGILLDLCSGSEHRLSEEFSFSLRDDDDDDADESFSMR